MARNSQEKRKKKLKTGNAFLLSFRSISIFCIFVSQPSFHLIKCLLCLCLYFTCVLIVAHLIFFSFIFFFFSIFFRPMRCKYGLISLCFKCLIVVFRCAVSLPVLFGCCRSTGFGVDRTSTSFIILRRQLQCRALCVNKFKSLWHSNRFALARAIHIVDEEVVQTMVRFNRETTW